MSHEVVLGFRKLPTDIDVQLAKLQFTFVKEMSMVSGLPVPIEVYHYFSKGISTTGVWVQFHYKVNDENLPGVKRRFTKDKRPLAMAVIITPFGANDADRRVQQAAVDLLQERYEEVIFDLETDGAQKD